MYAIHAFDKLKVIRIRIEFFANRLWLNLILKDKNLKWKRIWDLYVCVYNNKTIEFNVKNK